MTIATCVTHVIFDMDGLLLNTETFYTIAQQEILARHGRQFTWELKAKIMGKKALDAAQLLIVETGLQGQLSAQDFLKEREEILDRLFPTAQLMPGAEKLVRHLHACGVPMSVATSSHRRHFDIKTTAHKHFFELFVHITTGDQVTHGKPHPEIFMVAASKFNPPAVAEQCLVFEDAPTGVTAARAAGMAVIMVPDPNLDRSHCTQANKVLDSLERFQPQEWGLKPYPST
eukprot:jgi/Chrzof1/4782/Cz14g26080.t1